MSGKRQNSVKLDGNKVEDNDLDKDVEDNEVKYEETHDIMYTITPALIFENLFGIFRFEIIGNRFIPVSWTKKVIGFLIMSAYTILFCYFIELPNKVNGTSALVEVVDEIPPTVILIQYIATVISTIFFLHETTIKIFTTFIELDAALVINMNDDFYQKSKNRTIRILILITFIHLMFSLCDIFTDDKVAFLKFITLTLYFEQDLELYVFCKMIIMLRNRLGIVNEYLMKFVREKDNNKTPIFIINEKEVASDKQFNFIGRVSPNNMKIRDLAAMYDTIGNTCHMINELFKFQIFMNLVSTFTFIVLTIWTSLYYFRTPESISGPLVTVVLWCLLTILSVAVMSFICESLLTTRNTTKLLVNEIIMDYDLPRTMRVQAKVFMELIEAWPLRIFVYDMFSVDIKLMLKFISVATTYLIVIIQMSHFI